jgi:hypothetical protein
VLIAQTRLLYRRARTQIEDDPASSQLQAGYRECDLGFDRCFAVTDEPKRWRKPQLASPRPDTPRDMA